MVRTLPTFSFEFMTTSLEVVIVEGFKFNMFIEVHVARDGRFSKL